MPGGPASEPGARYRSPEILSWPRAIRKPDPTRGEEPQRSPCVRGQPRTLPLDPNRTDGRPSAPLRRASSSSSFAGASPRPPTSSTKRLPHRATLRPVLDPRRPIPPGRGDSPGAGRTKFACKACGKRIAVQEPESGTRIACPDCGDDVTVFSDGIRSRRSLQGKCLVFIQIRIGVSDRSGGGPQRGSPPPNPSPAAVGVSASDS